MRGEERRGKRLEPLFILRKYRYADSYSGKKKAKGNKGRLLFQNRQKERMHQKERTTQGATPPVGRGRHVLIEL